MLTYAGLDQVWDWESIVIDIAKRPFILVGFVAWLLMVPLAVTSTKGMLQRLGFRRWKRLHRLAYLSALLGVVHFVLRVKKDVTELALSARRSGSCCSCAWSTRCVPASAVRPRSERRGRCAGCGAPRLACGSVAWRSSGE